MKSILAVRKLSAEESAALLVKSCATYPIAVSQAFKMLAASEQMLAKSRKTGRKVGTYSEPELVDMVKFQSEVYVFVKGEK